MLIADLSAISGHRCVPYVEPWGSIGFSTVINIEGCYCFWPINDALEHNIVEPWFTEQEFTGLIQIAKEFWDEFVSATESLKFTDRPDLQDQYVPTGVSRKSKFDWIYGIWYLSISIRYQNQRSEVWCNNNGIFCVQI